MRAVKKFSCLYCSHISTEKEWRGMTKAIKGTSPYVERNIGRKDKEFFCPHCGKLVNGLMIKEEKEYLVNITSKEIEQLQQIPIDIIN